MVDALLTRARLATEHDTSCTYPGQTVVAMARPTPKLIETVGLWPLRLLWFGLPLLAGPGFSQMLDGRSAAVATVSEIGLWLMWFLLRDPYCIMVCRGACVLNFLQSH